MSTGAIYGLCDPSTGEMRYVGKTTHRPTWRLQGHLTNARGGGPGGAANWIRKLQANGLTPELVILERDPVGSLGEAERAWIAYARSMGCQLVNHSDGGDGGSEPCAKDCSCGRHSMNKCAPGCECGRHTRSGNRLGNRASGYKLSDSSRANIRVGGLKRWATYVMTDDERRNRSLAAKRRWARRKEVMSDVV